MLLSTARQLHTLEQCPTSKCVICDLMCLYFFQIMRSQVDRKSEDEGRETSRLPVFTEEEKTRIAGTYISIILYTFSH